MKKLIFGGMVVTLLVSLTAFAQSGQDNNAKSDAQESKTNKPAKEAKTVTGCLQKGDEPGEFSIQGEDGKVWGLKSSSVKVSVTGSASEESSAEEKREKKEGEVEKASKKEEYGDIRVASLKMISDSCK